MHFVSGKTSQKFQNIIDCHVINAALHGAKQVMVEMRHVDCLMEHKVVYLPVSWMVKCKDAADSYKCLQILLWVIPSNFHRLVVTLCNKGTSPKYSCICMRIKFQTCF